MKGHRDRIVIIIAILRIAVSRWTLVAYGREWRDADVG
jgi:hypothetical protein